MKNIHNIKVGDYLGIQYKTTYALGETVETASATYVKVTKLQSRNDNIVSFDAESITTIKKDGVSYIVRRFLYVTLTEEGFNSGFVWKMSKEAFDQTIDNIFNSIRI